MSKDKYKQKKYNINYKCGHEEKMMIGGYSQEYRDEIAKNLENTDCPSCRRAKEQEEAKKSAEKMNLPKLSGTEKQIAYAIVIRDDMIVNFSKHPKLSSYHSFNTNEAQTLSELFYKRRETLGLSVEERKIVEQEMSDEFDFNLQLAFDQFIATTTQAKEFVERSNLFPILNFNMERVMNFLKDFLPAQIEKKKFEEEVKREVRELKTIVPENFNRIIAEIKTNDNVIDVYCHKNEDFRSIVKKLKFQWNGSSWSREIGELEGTVEERLIEVAYKLIKNDFGVTIDVENFEELKGKIVNAEFKKEIERWILFDEGSDKLAIRWRGFDNELYGSGKKIPGARWSSGAFEVPLSSYMEVLDYARMYGFSLSESAEKRIYEFKEMFENIKREKPLEAVDKSDVSGLIEILNSDDEVLGDLIDD